MTAYSKDNFQGVIAVDSEGFVVWYANVTTVVSRDDRKLISSPHIVGFDQFADGSVCLAGASGAERVCYLGGEREVGESCEDGDECAAGAVCILEDGAAVCRRACDTRLAHFLPAPPP